MSDASETQFDDLIVVECSECGDLVSQPREDVADKDDFLCGYCTR